jgi:hypothetical protein
MSRIKRTARLLCGALTAVFVLLLSLEASPYTEWLDAYRPLLDVGARLDSDEIEKLDAELEIRPEGESADYTAWMTLFREKLDVGATLGETEKRVLEYVLSAKPENNGMQYPVFLDSLEKAVRDAAPVLNASEETILKLVLRAQTEPVPSPAFRDHLLAWQRRFQALRDEFGRQSAAEKRFLSFFREVRPRERAVAADDASRVKLRALLEESPASIAASLAANDYALGPRMVEIIEAFYARLERDAESTGDESKTELLQRLQNLEG